jgi:magnesium transporter
MLQHCAVYDSGVRRPGDLALSEASEASREQDSFAWVDLHEPGEPEFVDMTREFELPELVVEDAILAHQRPKLETYGDALFMVLKVATYIDSQEVVQIGEIMVFAGPNFVVVVRHGLDQGTLDVRPRLEREPQLLKHGPIAVLYALVDEAVDRYAMVLDGLDNDITEVEHAVFSDIVTPPTQRIYLLNREVLEFQQATAPLVPPLEQLASGRAALVDEELANYFRDVQDHLLRVVTRTENFRDLLSSVLQANLAQVGIRQNEDMRKISAWVAIAAVPTMIAGIYGMNFHYLPELEWRYGYHTVLGVIAVTCFFLYRAFRRNGWL